MVASPGGGATAVATDIARRARADGTRVVWATAVPTRPRSFVWAQVVLEAGGDEQLATEVTARPSGAAVEQVLALLAADPPTVVVVDGIAGQPERREPRPAHVPHEDGLELLVELAARLPSTSSFLLLTATQSLGVGTEVRLGPLGPDDFAALFPGMPAEVRQAVWIASRGLPGVAVRIALEIDASGTTDPVAHVALHHASRARFLDVDPALIELLEAAVAGAKEPAVRARLLSRLARELLGDASSEARRRQLVDDALRLARESGDRVAIADALDARLHALWDPAGVDERRVAASEIIEQARLAGDRALERRGLFWRFVALMELGRVDEAAGVLMTFRHAARDAGDDAALVMAAARDAMLATLRGRFDQAAAIIDEVDAAAARIDHPDRVPLVQTLRGALWMQHPAPETAETHIDVLLRAARYQPGHYYEATAARIMAMTGRLDAAAAELHRMLPIVRRGSGPRWLGAVADLAVVAAATGDRASAELLYEELEPYAGRWVLWGGANTAAGPVHHYLGLLASTVGDLDGAVEHLETARRDSEAVGALPSVVHASVALADAHARAGNGAAAGLARQRADAIAAEIGMAVVAPHHTPSPAEWTLTRDGDDWILDAGDERARLRDGRGLHYLRLLVSSPGRDIPALDLAGGGAGLAVPDEPVLDDAALAAYRRRLGALAQELDAADRGGDAARAAAAAQERDAVVDELRRAMGLGGRARRSSAASERARVNVTRTLRATIARIAVAAPRAAAHLEQSIRTGRACRYEPAAGGPDRWRT